MKENRQGKIPALEMTEITQNNNSPQECPTELKQLETALKESETKFRNIVNNAIEGIFQTDREGRFTHANPSFARIHGAKARL